MHKVKNNEIGLITAIACILVVFIHISSQAIIGLRKESIQLLLIYIPWRLSHFVVQCFILLSAVKIIMKYKTKIFDFKEYINFIKGRIINIFIPYMIWVMIYYIYFCSIDYFQFNIIDYINYVIKGDLASPFYFIVVIMQFYLLMPMWIYILNKFKPVFVILISVIINIVMVYYLPSVLNLIFNIKFIYNDRIFTSYLMYWVFGCYIAKFYNEFIYLIQSKKVFISISFILLAILTTCLSYIQFLGIKYFKYLEFIHIFYCIAAILFLYLICLYLVTKKNIFTQILFNINKCSFYIYLSHCFVLNIVNRQFELKQINDIGYMFIAKLVFCYCVPIILTNIYLYLKKRVA